jgi:hypothetical protein
MNLLAKTTGLAVTAVCLLGLTGGVGRAADPVDVHMHQEHFLKCAKACTDCQLMCDSCFAHCSALLVAGKKEHAETMQTCVDCAECCKLAATLSARQSPFAINACECCAKCCDDCATACEKFKDDKHMADCAKSCRDCAKACRDMLKHMKV